MVTERSVAGLTVVVWEVVLSAVFRSPTLPVTMAVFVRSPVILGLTTIVTVELSPLAMGSRLQGDCIVRLRAAG